LSEHSVKSKLLLFNSCAILSYGVLYVLFYLYVIFYWRIITNAQVEDVFFIHVTIYPLSKVIHVGCSHMLCKCSASLCENKLFSFHLLNYVWKNKMFVLRCLTSPHAGSYFTCFE